MDRPATHYLQAARRRLRTTQAYRNLVKRLGIVAAVLLASADAASLYGVPFAAHPVTDTATDHMVQSPLANTPEFAVLFHDESVPRRVEILLRDWSEPTPPNLNAPLRDYFMHFESQWLLSLSEPEIIDDEFLCLREAIYHEARGEDVVGQFAVAEVILNRVASGRYPDTICEVVYQNVHRRNACQFSYACNGRSVFLRDVRATAIAGRIAQLAVSGFDSQLTGGATHYHATSVFPHWATAMERTARYGAHIFYREDADWGGH
jgi:hypothetical protein